jgi:hypothetical protein
MANPIGSAVGSVIPTNLPTGQQITSSASNILLYGAIFLIVVIILIAGGVGLWILIRWWQYNKKITLYKDRNGYMEWAGTDSAREIIYNNYGDSVFYWRKRRIYTPRGEIEVGKNKYIYVIAEDGEKINVGLESINSKLRQLGLHPVHPDARAFKSGMVRIIKDRHEKKAGLKEFALMLAPWIFIIFCIIGLYFIADKLVSFLDKMPTVVTALNAVLDKANQILTGVNNVCATTGIKQG